MIVLKWILAQEEVYRDCKMVPKRRYMRPPNLAASERRPRCGSPSFPAMSKILPTMGYGRGPGGSNSLLFRSRKCQCTFITISINITDINADMARVWISLPDRCTHKFIPALDRIETLSEPEEYISSWIIEWLSRWPCKYLSIETHHLWGSSAKDESILTQMTQRGILSISEHKVSYSGSKSCQGNDVIRSGSSIYRAWAIMLRAQGRCVTENYMGRKYPRLQQHHTSTSVNILESCKSLTDDGIRTRVEFMSLFSGRLWDQQIICNGSPHMAYSWCSRRLYD